MASPSFAGSALLPCAKLQEHKCGQDDKPEHDAVGMCRHCLALAPCRCRGCVRVRVPCGMLGVFAAAASIWCMKQPTFCTRMKKVGKCKSIF